MPETPGTRCASTELSHDIILQMGGEPDRDVKERAAAEKESSVQGQESDDKGSDRGFPAKMLAWLSPFRRYNDDRSRYIRSEQIEERVNGYPRLAAVIGSDPNFCICRRFNYPRIRIILQKQDKITKLTERLDGLDRRDAEKVPFILQSRKYDIDRGDPEREDLLNELSKELKEYDDLIIRQRAISGIEPPTSRNYNSVFNYIHNEKPLCEEESETFFLQEDFVSLANGQDNTWLDGTMEDMLEYLPLKLSQKIFATPEKRKKSAEYAVHYYSKERVRLLSKSITILVTIILLMVPVSLLFALEMREAVQVAVVLVFVLVFPGAIAACTRAKHQEIFAATAAYCAVLVVFLSNFKTNTQEQGKQK